MDYGKLAYIKAEELESRLNADKRAADEVTGVTLRPSFDFSLGEYALPSVYACGGVTLTVRARIRADESASEDEIVLLINGMRAASTAVTAEKGRSVDALIICAVRLNGTAELRLSAFGKALVLKGVQLAVCGEGAALESIGGDAAADKCGNTWCMVEVEDGSVIAYAFSEPNASFNPHYIGAGRYADVTKTDDGFLIAYSDESKNAFAVFTDKSLSTVSRTFVCGGAESVTATAYCGGYAFVTVESGRVAVRFIGKGGGGSSAPSYPELDGGVKAVRFVKNADSPMLVLRYSDRSVLRLAQPETGGTESITLTVTPAMKYY